MLKCKRMLEIVRSCNWSMSIPYNCLHTLQEVLGDPVMQDAVKTGNDSRFCTVQLCFDLYLGVCMPNDMLIAMFHRCDVAGWRYFRRFSMELRTDSFWR